MQRLNVLCLLFFNSNIITWTALKRLYGWIYLYYSPTHLHYLWPHIYIYRGAVGAGELEVSPVTLYTKQSSAHKCCFIRDDMQDEMKMTSNIFWRQTVSIRNTLILEHLHWFSILKRAELNQSPPPPPANHSNFRWRDLKFVMSQIQENNFVVQTNCSL